MINKNSKIYLAGHTGLVGSSLLRVLKKKGFKKIILKKRKELNLTNQAKVFNFLKKTKPAAIVMCAAKVGGISANNKFKSEFIYENLNNEIINSFKLIINCSPVGTYPNTNDSPNIPYQYLTEDHILYDLIYNPAETLFLNKGRTSGCKIKNGLEMLEVQANEAWRIWNS